mmetsp:Transcript_43307/g.98531  ORF Transcript_43307/g.98531 Transcript_43307/m.98531 type:complete len:559 (+) Transcript_43307:8-1684(+)
MAGGRLPTWGFVVASVAACCVVAMVALAVNPKPASLLSLPGMHAKQDPMQAQQVLSFLTKNSNTPNAEVKFLEDRLGVKSAGKAAALKASPAAKAGAVTPDQVGKYYRKLTKAAKYNVPYFSTFVQPQPKGFTKGGMHDSVRQLEESRALQGLDDTVGEKLGAKAGKALGDELSSTITSVNVTPEETFLAAKLAREGKAMTPAAEKNLAGALEQGEAFANLPNHGKAKKMAVVKDPRALGAALEAGEHFALNYHRQVKSKKVAVVHDAKKLGEALLAGEKAALEYEAPAARSVVRKHVLTRKQGEALAARLNSGEQWAMMQSAEAAKARAPAKPKGLSMAQAEKLSASLEKAENDPHWKKETDFKKPARELSAKQDKHLAKRLKQGLKQAFPVHHPVAKHYMGKRLAKEIEQGAKVGQAMETHNDYKAPKKFVTRASGPALARELTATLHTDMRAEGPYVADYVKKVSGHTASWAAHKAVAPKMVNGMSAARAKGLALEHDLEAGEKMVASAKNARAARKASYNSRVLSPEAGRNLARYLVPGKHIAKGAAPALGYAV